jgi:hypothetical protein
VTSFPNAIHSSNKTEQVVAHQPAVSFSISFQHQFNRAGGRTSNVGQNKDFPMENETTAKRFDTERRFLEGLLQARFNFFILAYTMVIYSALTARTQSQFYFTVWTGILLLALLAYPIFRIYVKVDAVLKAVHAIKDPAVEASKVGVERHWPDFGQANRWIGYVIPLFCVGSLIIWLVLVCSGIVVIN